jgi:HK97 family phage major capsid protein
MELKEFADQFTKDWTEFKNTNDQILAAKADGKAVGELETKLANINKALDGHQETADRLAKLETTLRRSGLESKGSQLSSDQLEHKAAFMQWFRKGEDQGLAELEKKALSVNDDTSGGFMVHADLGGRIVKRIFETSPIRQYASVQTISTDALEGPVDADEADYGWVAESGARAQTRTPKIGMWRIPTHEVYAQPAATQKLLDDAAWNPEEWLSLKIADKIARVENSAFVLGDGIGKPKGFLAYPGIADSASINFFDQKKIGFIKTGTANDFAPVPATGADPAQADSLINLVFSLKSQYREMAGTAFGMHRTTFGRVRRLRDNLGNYLWQPGLGGLPSTLLGYPIAEFNDMPQLGDTNKYAVAFGNWREAYQIVDRAGIRMLRDPYTAKPFVLFYSTKRVGGDVVNFEALKLLSFTA